MKHELKTWPEYYQQVRDGIKPFEYRNDDRGFKVGDELVLREWCPIQKIYTDRGNDEEIHATITSILNGFGLPKGYVIMGIPRVKIIRIDRDHGKGKCMEKHCDRYATTDYSGHGYFVCDTCDRILNDRFDEEYR